MYVKVLDDGTNVFPYTLSDFRADNPRTSYPAEIPEEILNEQGVFVVEVETPPEFDQMTHQLRWHLAPVSNTRWAKKWSVEPLDEIDAATIAVIHRNKRLAETDWCGMSDVVMSDEMRSYRQALRDITEQEGFPFSISWPEKPLK